jgi:hypothetical protein
VTIHGALLKSGSAGVKKSSFQRFQSYVVPVQVVPVHFVASR